MRIVPLVIVRRVAVAVFALGATTSPASAQTEQIEYYGLDALGSVRVIFDAQGNTVDRMDYGPFGENLRAAIRFPVEQFARLQRDAESGNDYAKARNYSVSIGRFNGVDPLFASMLDPQQLNRYAYAKNSPLTFADPEGLQAWKITARIKSVKYLFPPMYDGLGSAFWPRQPTPGGGGTRPGGGGNGRRPTDPDGDDPTEPVPEPDGDSTDGTAVITAPPPETTGEAFAEGCKQGFAAMIDSAIPLADPLSRYYDPDAPGIWFSQDVGGPLLQGLATFGGARALATIAGRASSGVLHTINHNPWLRIGTSTGGQPRIAVGPHLGRPPTNIHIPLATPTLDRWVSNFKSIVSGALRGGGGATCPR